MEDLKALWGLVEHSCVLWPFYLRSLWVRGLPQEQETQLSGRVDTLVYQKGFISLF